MINVVKSVNEVYVWRLIRSAANSGYGGFHVLRYTTAAHRQNNDNLYDVVISGGGMVGTAMATAIGSVTTFLKGTVFINRSLTIFDKVRTILIPIASDMHCFVEGTLTGIIQRHFVTSVTSGCRQCIGGIIAAITSAIP